MSNITNLINRLTDHQDAKHIDECHKVMQEAALALGVLHNENENIRRANLDCMEHFNELMKDYNELHKELLEIEERKYQRQLIESQ